jgi:hypothetical protein
VERSVKTTLDPLQTLVLLALKLALRAHPWRVMGKDTCAPAQPVARDSTTLTLPLLDPKFTVTLLLLGPVAPEVRVAPVGSVHA